MISIYRHNNHRNAEEISQRKFAYRKPEKPCSSISSAKSNRYAKLDINPPGETQTVIPEAPQRKFLLYRRLQCALGEHGIEVVYDPIEVIGSIPIIRPGPRYGSLIS